ncbi:E3 ubiquitin-protein ligase MGRN1-like isoform X2 [Littorina saxatilis]|uniref:RING-type E3 ubiquitin transferase n=1 Tax=Littorina saxatilis TaxID=31220 RepID=A0AAN9BT30_9CAEN
MGASLTTRRNTGVESVDLSSTNAYRYPPKTGSYFGSHFIMGGERFESPQPGEYLFGENEDLNFLGNKPVPFPYAVPTGNEPTKTLKSLIYIRKDSLRLVKAMAAEKLSLDQEDSGTLYNLEFVFDCDARCAIKIHYFAAEEVAGGQVMYQSRQASMCSEVFHYKRGVGQVFSQPAHLIEPSKFPEEDWQYSWDKEVYPIVIHCQVEEEEHAGHSHIMYAVVEKIPEGSFIIKPLKQKQFVDGLCYLLQEIYGIENKNMERLKDVDPDEEVEDSGAECVICMSDMRDTLILPCRHLCLCSACAESLRYQASMCPICRVKFRALLQIRAMRKKMPPVTGQQQTEPEENPVSQEGVPPGYEAISLVEALNGQVVSQNGQTDGVNHPIGVPPSLLSVDKKGHKETKVTLSTSIEYQKEMDPAMDNKKNDEKELEKEEQSDDNVVSTPLSRELPPSGLEPAERRRSPEKKTGGEEAAPNNRGQAVTARPATKASGPKSGEMRLQLSTGDMADDEREDSSTEPEPDYELEEEAEEESYTLSDRQGMASSESVVSGTLSGQLSSPEMEPLHVNTDVRLMLTEVQGSGTEGSSFGSNCSSHALLNAGEPIEDREQKMTI